MKILVIETSNDHALLAAIEENQLVTCTRLPGGPALSNSIALEMKKILAICPFPYHRIVVGIGPGSYTGLRVGMALAQALALGWAVPIYSVSSLTAFAPDAPDFAVLVDARSGGVYIQKNFEPPRLVPLPDATPFLQDVPLLVSPHPARLQQRLPTLQNASWLETQPNPLLMAHHAAPFHGQLLYLS
ncbi:MAG: tRNA (adenosine(37)-N6)-threonylcarbamoyltransferase complex dimerization subunit type 1 TsaB [Verrucomicrobiota bacterium]|nr:tRNA (adenosine(37)-N6)-threonylcarbamoyltransferase complex dimerization subunit type 1 TsaB [Verrucomicrobiota bacterium]